MGPILAFSEVGETIDYRFAGLFIKKTNTKWAASSVVEREVDVFEAVGSIPTTPSVFSKVEESLEERKVDLVLFSDG